MIGEFEAARGEITPPKSNDNPHEKINSTLKFCVLLCFSSSLLLIPIQEIKPRQENDYRWEGELRFPDLPLGPLSPGRALCDRQRNEKKEPCLLGESLIFAKMNPFR